MRVIATTILAVSACAQTPAVESQPVDDLVACGGGKVRPLIGRTYDEALAGEVQRLSGAGAIRWIRPGQAITMDYRDDRLNLELDQADRIVRVRCG